VTQRYIALLRGVNVGRANRLSMDDFKAVLSRLGYDDPRTLLNSGNAVFSASPRPEAALAAEIEAGLAEQCGLSVRVVVISAEQLAEAIALNPLTDIADDPSRLLVSFFRDDADVARLDELTARDWTPEVFAVVGCVAYLWLPAGVTSSALAAALARLFGDAVTSRNWATVLKLRDLSS